MKTDEDITDEQLLKIARWDIDNQRDNGTMRSCGEEVTEDCDNERLLLGRPLLCNSR